MEVNIHLILLGQYVTKFHLAEDALETAQAVNEAQGEEIARLTNLVAAHEEVLRERYNDALQTDDKGVGQ